jgi:hypothetical protein
VSQEKISLQRELYDLQRMQSVQSAQSSAAVPIWEQPAAKMSASAEFAAASAAAMPPLAPLPPNLGSGSHAGGDSFGFGETARMMVDSYYPSSTGMGSMGMGNSSMGSVGMMTENFDPNLGMATGLMGAGALTEYKARGLHHHR